MSDEEHDEFTAPKDQAEFDRMVAARINRERAKFADYDDLKTKANKFDEVDAASKTELDQLRDMVGERDRQLAELPNMVRAQAIRFASKATAKGFLDPEDALTLAGDVDLSDDAAIDVALDALAERKPHLVNVKQSKPATRPKPVAGEQTDGDQPKGKERAAAALRQFRNV